MTSEAALPYYKRYNMIMVFLLGLDRLIPDFDRLIPSFDRFIGANIVVIGNFPIQAEHAFSNKLFICFISPCHFTFLLLKVKCF